MRRTPRSRPAKQHDQPMLPHHVHMQRAGGEGTAHADEPACSGDPACSDPACVVDTASGKGGGSAYDVGRAYGSDVGQAYDSDVGRAYDSDESRAYGSDIGRACCSDIGRARLAAVISVERAAATSAEGAASVEGATPDAYLAQQVGRQNPLREMQARIDRTEQSLSEIKDMLARLVPGPPFGTGSMSTDAARGETIEHHSNAHPTGLATAERGLAAEGLPSPSAPWPSLVALHGPTGSCTNNMQMPHDNVTSFVSPCLPIHSYVSDKDRMKVWSGEYIDLMTLLKADHAGEPSYALSFSMSYGGLAPEIHIDPPKKPTMKSYSQWAKGFQVYISI